MMGWGPGFGWMGWFGWLWPLVMLLFWVVVIGLSVRLVGSSFSRSTTHSGSTGTALDTLKRRYAGGEITGEEFEEGRRLLGT